MDHLKPNQFDRQWAAFIFEVTMIQSDKDPLVYTTIAYGSRLFPVEGLYRRGEVVKTPRIIH